MARSHARLLVSIWRDPDWLALSPEGRIVLLMLLSQPTTLDHPGDALALDLDLWSSFLQPWTRDDLWVSLMELEAAGWLELGVVVRLLRLEQLGGRASAPRPFAEEQRARVTPAVRQLVLDRDGSVCRACGALEHLEIDHIHPVSKGGTSDLDNLAVLCRACNSRKSAKPWLQFIEECRAADP